MSLYPLAQGGLYPAAKSDTAVVEISFTETTGAGTYTGTVAIPAGATVLDVIWRNTVLWAA